MEAQDEQVYGPTIPDVTAALLDFARLSQRVGSAVSDESGLIAMNLLERILTLFVAQKGAVLLTTQYLNGLKSSSVSSLSPRKMFRPFALSGISEEVAMTLLANFSLEGADVQVPPGEPGWLICRLPVTAPLIAGQDVETIQYITDHPSQTILPLYALVVLGWTVTDECARINMVERGRMVMPRIADAFGAAVQSVLLAGRIHELETISDRKALREMELLKAELLATVSHELRSPLASIKGYAATLLRHERRISREERHEFLLAINEASDRLEVVIDRLLEVSQLETGTIAIDRASVNLAHLAREAIIALEERLIDPQDDDPLLNGMSSEPKRFTFTVHVEDAQGRPTAEEPILQADRLRLREVLDNLLENAINYSPEGGVIEVGIRPILPQSQKEREKERSATLSEQESKAKKALSTRPTLRRDQRMMEICVHDNGIGIPSGQLKAIFERFHRVDTRLTREVNGIGLGLAICKHIVELHDGMIWAESEFGKGSTFHVWLPMDINE
jgi:signal transduction histidine kinase